MWDSKSRKHEWPRLIGIAAGACLIAAWCPAAQAVEPTIETLNENSAATVELPLLSGWYDGDVVFYIGYLCPTPKNVKLASPPLRSACQIEDFRPGFWVG